MDPFFLPTTSNIFFFFNIFIIFIIFFIFFILLFNVKYQILGQFFFFFIKTLLTFISILILSQWIIKLLYMIFSFARIFQEELFVCRTSYFPRNLYFVTKLISIFHAIELYGKCFRQVPEKIILSSNFIISIPVCIPHVMVIAYSPVTTSSMFIFYVGDFTPFQPDPQP